MVEDAGLSRRKPGFDSPSPYPATVAGVLNEETVGRVVAAAVLALVIAVVFHLFGVGMIGALIALIAFVALVFR